MTTTFATTSIVAHVPTVVATLTAAHPAAACRIERGARLVADDAVSPIYGIGHLVASESEPGRSYWVMRANDVLTCDCADARQRGCPCKHGWAVIIFQAAERLDAEQSDPDAEIPYTLTARAIAVLEPTRECAACDDQAEDHDGPEGQCTRQGVDADGLWICDCPAFDAGDDAA